MLGTVLGLIFPALCVGCNKELRSEALCGDCKLTLTTQTAPQCPHCDFRVPFGKLSTRCRKVLLVSHIAIAYPYDHPMAKAQIDALKYEGLMDLAHPLGESIAEAIQKQWRTADPITLIPVPLHRRRENERGYNQSVLIANEMIKNINATVDSNLLVRIKNTPRQVGLRASERRDNMNNAFRVTGTINPDASYVIVDDVTTTGATIRECARALRIAGAKNVLAATVAQG